MTRKIFGGFALAVLLLAGLTTAGVLYAQQQMQDRMGGHGMGMMGMMSMMKDCPMMGARAQSPGAVLEHREDLSLSDAQVKTLESLRDRSQQARMQAMERMKSVHGEIAAATEGERFDEPAARAAFDRMGDLHTEMGVAMLRTRNEVRQLLTPRQRQKLDEMGNGMMDGGMMNMMQNCPMMQGGMMGQGMMDGMRMQDSAAMPMQHRPQS